MPRLRRRALRCATQLDTCYLIPGLPTSVQSIFTMHPCVFPSLQIAVRRAFLDLINNRSFAIPGIMPDLDSSGTRIASHVFQKWRHIALAVPSLWTIIREDDDESAALCFTHRPPLSRRTMRVLSLHAHVFGACS